MSETSLVTVDSFRQVLLSKKAALNNFLGSEKNALRFMSAVAHCIQTTPKLLDCTRESLMGAFMTAASLNLYPGGNGGDCYILPYRSKAGTQAQFQIGYRGFKTLAYRSGILRCGTEVVYANDKFSQELGTIQKLIHIPATGERGDAIGAYAWSEVTQGNIVFKYMTRDQVMEIKKTSKSKDSQYSPWNANDPEKWMWQKTSFKQLAKLLPTSDDLDRAVHLDNVSERGGYIKSENEIVEAPFEDPEVKIGAVKDQKQTLREKKKETSPIQSTPVAKNS